jgi:cell fate regulator YaaT (PSP1 superfamily)
MVIPLIEGIEMSDQQTVVAVKLRYNPKIFWFDPALSTYEAGDHVLVDTERGREIGLVVDPELKVTNKQVKELKTPLKPVIRALAESDFDRIDELDAKGHEALPAFRELINKHSLDMKPVSVEFLFSGEKAVFYFSSDERVDFRDLVRDLASRFHTRVDMRQIGVRDEARILGGLAHCGEELCCARLGGEFQPVSIRMAKEQDLPLNPSKISGACGRLMCCLRYEFEAYKDFKNRAPKKGALIGTPIGQAKVVDFDTPREIITMRLEDGKLLSIPLSEFECSADENGKKCPCSVSRDAIDRCASSSILMALTALEQELSQSAAAERSGSGAGAGAGERSVRRPRRSGRQNVEGSSGAEGARGAQAARGAGRADEQDGSADRGSGGRGAANSRRKGAQKVRPRPGQHSSGLRGGGNDRNAGGSGNDRNTDRAGDRNASANRERGQGTGDDRGANQRGSRNANRGRRPAGSDVQAPREQMGENNSERSGGDGRRRRRRRSEGGPPRAGGESSS